MSYDRRTNSGWNRRRKAIVPMPLPLVPLAIPAPYQIALSVLAGFLIGLVSTDLAHRLSDKSPTPGSAPPEDDTP